VVEELGAFQELPPTVQAKLEAGGFRPRSSSERVDG
jgi:hypothetical protein